MRGEGVTARQHARGKLERVRKLELITTPKSGG
jgi:hypothetical protein